MSRIYFDNSATTPCLPAVAEVVNTVLLDTYGNPSSMHRVGIEAEKVLKNARRQVAEALQVESKEIFSLPAELRQTIGLYGVRPNSVKAGASTSSLHPLSMHQYLKASPDLRRMVFVFLILIPTKMVWWTLASCRNC